MQQTRSRNQGEVPKTKNCRLGCGCEESQLHLFQCKSILPFWKAILTFLSDSGFGKPKHVSLESTLILGLVSATKLWDEVPRATLRHAFRTLYRDLTRLEVDKRFFIPQDTLASTLTALKSAVLRRAHQVKRHHANNVFAKEANVISQKDADKYHTLISMSTNGKHTINPAFESAIKQATTKADEERARLVDNAKHARAQRRPANPNPNPPQP